jgi:hypothetical protein
VGNSDNTDEQDARPHASATPASAGTNLAAEFRDFDIFRGQYRSVASTPTIACRSYPRNMSKRWRKSQDGTATQRHEPVSRLRRKEAQAEAGRKSGERAGRCA